MGQQTICSVKVGSSSSTASGTVSFAYESTILGTATLTGGSAYILVPGSLPAGLDDIVATYSGDSTYNSATGSVTLNVQDPTATRSTLYSYTVPAGGYEANGNVVAYTDSVMGSWTFGYDQLNRLTTAVNSPVSEGANWAQNFSWGYDSYGNRLWQNNTDAAGTPASLYNSGATYNSQNQMTYSSASGIVISPVYDSAGNVVADGTNTYLYDAEGRICAVKSSSGTTTGYQYDAAGNRVAKGSIATWSCDITTNGFHQTAGYVVGPSGEQLTEVDATNNWVHTNVYAGGKLIGTYDGNVNSPTLHFYIDDPLGTRRAQISAAGVLEATYQSLPFGDGFNPIFYSYNYDGPTENHFTNKERDTETGNDYFEARYYGSMGGRFLSPDPLAGNRANPQSLNRYVYALNNPLRFTDPTGMYVCEDSTECNSDNDKKFAMGLNNAAAAAAQLTIKNGLGSDEAENAERAVDAYGDAGVENGVNVRFSSNIASGTGVTEVSGVANGQNDAENHNPNKQNINVTFNPDAAGNPGLIAHEGSHVADGEAWVASGFSPNADPTKFQTELDAYHVQFSVMEVGLSGSNFGFLAGTPMTSGESFSGFYPDLKDYLKGDPYRTSPADKTRAFTKGGVVPY